ncbi:MAG TPA: MarR family winged helix-turn-helix transcriptional regulator [Puia sp.]|nr:MarR family winged helix-turn-helix transcriptional regulator [Puia sp.]
MKPTVVEEIRAFNRFYTGIIGLLDQYLLKSEFTLPEARVLYEIYHHDAILAGEIIATLNMDKGYLSRMLDTFDQKRLISRNRSARDGRSVHISLTAKGKKEFEKLNQASRDQMKNMLALLPEEDGDKLLLHMAAIKQILSKTQKLI